MAPRLFFRLALALVFGGLVAVFPDQPDRLPRVLLGIALVLLATDCLDAAQAGRNTTLTGATKLRDLRRWLYAWLFAMFYLAVMTLIQWEGPRLAPPQVLLNFAVGAVIGAVLAFVTEGTPKLAPPFDLSSPADDTRLGAFVTYGWPFAATALVLGSALDPPDAGWNGVYPAFQMVFLPFILQLYPLAGGFRDSFPDHVPRLLGIALLVTGLIIS
ncbi:hypothetical protein [Pseudaestuariivita sp.]|uniref:hypothetical protein n=1 Tax=Pseudaestuariivita sp. TaxID=2211669 RepID=UPI0040581A6D